MYRLTLNNNLLDIFWLILLDNLKFWVYFGASDDHEKWGRGKKRGGAKKRPLCKTESVLKSILFNDNRQIKTCLSLNCVKGNGRNVQRNVKERVSYVKAM